MSLRLYLRRFWRFVSGRRPTITMGPNSVLKDCILDGVGIEVVRGSQNVIVSGCVIRDGRYGIRVR